MAKNKTINIQHHPVLIVSHNNEDYISLTDMARSQLQDVIIIKWLSLKNTIEYIGEWEALYNPHFNYTEFGIIRNTAGGNNFVPMPWFVSSRASRTKRGRSKLVREDTGITNPYEPIFPVKIKKGNCDKKAGNSKTIKTENLWK